jgi:hypothetical protein
VVFFYISGHGFGHASRQIEIINALGAVCPEAGIAVRTSAPRWLFERTVRVPYVFVPAECDTGIVQTDSLRLDARATIQHAAAFHRTLDERAEIEAGILRGRSASLVIADAPPLACASAAVAGVPAVVVSNFTWDWIYEEYREHLEQAPTLIASMQRAYSCAAEGWRLPMHGGFETFSTIRDVPFVARHARHDRPHVRATLGLPLDAVLALTSFGGYGVSDFDLAHLDCLDHYEVVVTVRDSVESFVVPSGVRVVPESRLYGSGLRYEDLVHAVDVVVTKPGYGIIAECIANGPAMLYTTRGRFAEYPVLVSEMPRFLKCAFIDQRDLLTGRWRDALDRLSATPAAPERAATNGAEVVAELIRRRLSDPKR